MMVNRFDELADRAKATWSDDARRVYEAVSSELTAEVNERAELGAVLAAVRSSSGSFLAIAFGA